MEKEKLSRYSELARFLRIRRERITPEQAGLPESGRRRTPGLRRFEVAMLAEVSLEWYTFLEQGRHINVSRDVLERLASALQLNETERRHMFLLAQRQPPPVPSDASPQSEVNDVLQRFLDDLGTSPACVMDARMNIIAWNAAQIVVCGELEPLAEQDRNLVWITFTSEPFRQLKGEQWEQHARRTVAQFHAVYASFPDDPWWSEQVEALSAVSAEFRALWKSHEVLDMMDAHKTFQHPVAGILNFDFISFQSLESRDLQVCLHVPRRDGTAEKVQKLLDM